MSPSTPGGPGGKYLGRTGPLDAADLWAVRADLLDQLAREPEVLDALEAAMRAGDRVTMCDILRHLRDLVTLMAAWVQCTKVGDDPPPLDPAA